MYVFSYLNNRKDGSSCKYVVTVAMIPHSSPTQSIIENKEPPNIEAMVWQRHYTIWANQSMVSRFCRRDGVRQCSHIWRRNSVKSVSELTLWLCADGEHVFCQKSRQIELTCVGMAPKRWNCITVLAAPRQPIPLKFPRFPNKTQLSLQVG